ncbi:MAG: type II toxin-antitoxin system VapB family antitoxin [Thermoanaerobaculia bacterium]
MIKRTTIEIDQELLHRAKQALGQPTTRGTVEEALRRATEGVESEQARQGARQRRYFEVLGSRADLAVLASEAMWR